MARLSWREVRSVPWALSMLCQVPRCAQTPFAISLHPLSGLLYALLLRAHTCVFIQRTAFGLQEALRQNRQSAENAGELTSLGSALSQ